MKQQKWLMLSLFTFCALASANLFAGHGAWKGGGPGLAKPKISQAESAMTESDFISALSPYHRKKYMNFSQAQKRAAMLYMEKNKLSPDNAIEQALRDHIYKR